jgi:hypothetical protein
MVVFGAAIAYNPRLHFLKAYHIKIACKLGNTNRAGRKPFACKNAEQRVVRRRKTTTPVKVGYRFKMLHNPLEFKVVQVPQRYKIKYTDWYNYAP